MKQAFTFSLKAILGVILALSLPLAMIAAGGDWLLGGGLLVIPVTGGATGYLLAGRRGVYPGAMFAMILAIAALILLTVVL